MYSVSALLGMSKGSWLVLQVGINDEKSHGDARSILIKMGEYYQIQVGFFKFLYILTVTFSSALWLLLAPDRCNVAMLRHASKLSNY